MAVSGSKTSDFQGVLSQGSAEVCTEICSIHKEKMIEFFCIKHETFGCSDCAIVKHRNCYLDFIQDKCVGIGDSEEYREIMQKLQEKIKETDAVMNKAAVINKEIDDSHESVRKEFFKQEVQGVLTLCTNYTSDIKKLHSSLQNSKATNQNGKIFMDFKRAQSKLQSEEIQQAEMSLEKTDAHFKSERNKELERILSVENFGNLIGPVTSGAAPTSTPVTPVKKRTFRSLTSKTTASIKTDTDEKGPDITSCVALSTKRLVLADCENQKLKVVNTENNVIMEEKKLDTGPYDIAVLPGDCIAVTLPSKTEVLLMTTTGKLSTYHSFSVEGNCRSVTYHQDCLYVLSWYEDHVPVLDLKGNVKASIPLKKTGVVNYPNYLVLSQDHKLLYFSSYRTKSIVSVTLEGEVSAVYKDKDLGAPEEMLVLDDGSLLVCCYNVNSIHHVSADLKQGQTVMHGLSNPKAICYSADRSQIYVGGWNDQIRVFDIL